MAIVDFYDARPDELKSGDVLVCTVTLHVSHHLDANGKPYFRMYRCRNDSDGDNVPQGSRIYNSEDKLASILFPVVNWAELKSDS